MEITINYFARQYVDENHEFIKETLSTSKQTYHHRLCRLVRDHDFASIAKVELGEESTEIYEQKLTLNPIWRTVEKINRAGKNPAHAQVVT